MPAEVVYVAAVLLLGLPCCIELLRQWWHGDLKEGRD